MNKALIALLALIVSISKGQEFNIEEIKFDTIKLTLIGFNPCTSKYENDYGLLFSLGKNGSEYYPTDTLGTFLLPYLGRYDLKLFGKSMYYNIEITTKEHIYDTIRVAQIYECVYVSPHTPYSNCGYVCCNKPCEGYNIDYHLNGNRWIEGTFKNGQPVGNLTFYNTDGTVREIHAYDPDGNGTKLKVTKGFR